MAYLYVFIDEAGDFNFKPNGSKYFLLTSVTTRRPFDAFKDLHCLRYDFLELGIEVDEYFHATEDKQRVRDSVFAIIRNHLEGVCIDALIVEKSKVGPALREVVRFYPEMLGYLLRYVLRSSARDPNTEVLIFLAALHTGQQKRAVQKAVKQTLARMLPSGAKHRIIYHGAKANFDIQIADYCTWAIYKKWTHEEFRPFEVIKRAVRTEFDIFRKGTRHYY
jgi:Protein of unknown function (DUF3800)